ncbi:MAG TPA: hypothetical protein VF359_01205 [Anaerolineales bacterium]
MAAYKFPDIKLADPVNANKLVLVASGDLRLSANQKCWPAQEQMEAQLGAAFARLGWKVARGHAVTNVSSRPFMRRGKPALSR